MRQVAKNEALGLIASLGSPENPAVPRTIRVRKQWIFGSDCATLGALAPFTALGRPWPSRYLDFLSNEVGGIPFTGATQIGLYQRPE
ncbi:hypothetical protein [Anaerosporomusa subterranea]|nr:hypothetical protein [Anaerosporomusa subterranea]